MHIFIATPMFGAQCAGIYTHSMCQLYDLCVQNNIKLQHKFIYNGSLIPTLRNNLAHEFLASDATHLMFIDADIGFDPSYVIELANLQQTSGYNVIGATYLKKNIHWDKILDAMSFIDNPDDLNYFTGDYTIKLINGQKFNNKETNIVEAEYIGAGFMMIPRNTLDAFKLQYIHHPQYTYDNGKRTLFFNVEIQNDKYISEDIFFCNMVRNMGGIIGCCPWMKLSHLGNHTYGGTPTQFIT